MVIRGNTYMLHATVHSLLSDGDGLRQALEWLGAIALKPCFRHWNVFSPSSDLADRCSSSRQYVTTACTDVTAFHTWRNADLQRAWAVLALARQRHASGEIPYARVEEIQQAYGYRFSADGLVADDELSAIIDWTTVVQYDWVHVMLSGGVLLRVVWSMLAVCEELGLPGQRVLCEFLKGWKVPRASQHGARDVGLLWRFFDPKSASENKKRQGVRCNASELLALSRCLDEFISTQLPDDPRLVAHKGFFLAARATIDLLMQVKLGSATCLSAADAVARSARDQLARFVELHGSNEANPKFHWALNLSEQMRHSEHLMDAFVIERLHLRARAVADFVKYTHDYEVSLSAGVINVQVGGSGTASGLEGRTAQFPHPELPHVRVADRLSTHGKRNPMEDWVQCGEEFGRVLACVEERGELYLIVTLASVVRSVSRRGRLCTLVGGERALWSPTDSHGVAGWRPTATEGEFHVMMQ